MRVIAGRLRSRQLRSVPGRDTRPTTDRARAGLFDWLGSRVSGQVLDLYAGTGALGIEALSRDCHRAVFVERGRRALGVLRGNLTDLGLDEVSEVIPRDVRRALAQLAAQPARFQLILADPPYEDDWNRGPGASIEIAALLAPGGVLIVERAERSPRSEAAGLVYRASRTYGEAAFDWFERAGEDEP